MMISLLEMLEARELRVARQRELLAQYQMPLISFTMNIAGPVKQGPDILRGYILGKQILEKELMVSGLKLEHFEETICKTGNEAFYVVDGEPIKIKKITTALEDGSEIGRLFDFDVLRSDGTKMERQMIGHAGRTCLICERPAQECARSRTHSVKELQNRTQEIFEKTFDGMDVQTIGDLAVRALLYEVCTTPKPGLVDGWNNGSHRDMDIFTFINSAGVLRPYFEQCARIGRRTRQCSPQDTFSLLRREGMRAELDMFAETKGVNTHKGAVFSVGLVCAALGRLSWNQWKESDQILDECAAMTSGLVEADLQGIKAFMTGNQICGPDSEPVLTTGQKLYIMYKITGARGQAEDGFPAIRTYGFPVLRNGIKGGHTIHEAGCGALLAMMVHSVDTNLIARSDLETQQRVVEEVKALLEENPYPSLGTLKALDQQFIEQNLSPGGSADLLAICYLLFFLSEMEG